MANGDYKPMMVVMAAMTSHHLLMLTVTNGGDPSVYVNGQKVLPSRPTTAEGRRKWALEQAIAFAAADPELKATEADILAGAERFLKWLEAGKPTPKPSQMPNQPEGGPEVEFV